ncbi:MAG TPA: hypothetical protein ENK14_00675 [Caldithrix sp.]|nr:hypothetical protein [Caldithrix sp.]
MQKNFSNFFHFIFLLPILILLSCLATTNYYTGRTLLPGKKVVVGGIDNFLIKDIETGQTVRFGLPYMTSLGFAAGLPRRLETGLYWHFPESFETYLRWQANPRSFCYFDLSLNSHFGVFAFSYPYIKLGVSLSKEIHGVEPFLNYYVYTNAKLTEEFKETSRSLGLGIAIPIPRAQLIPEINFSFTGNEISKGLMMFNVGLRARVEHKKRN